MLADFDARIANIPQDLCGPFHSAARQLESELLIYYRLAVLRVKEEGENLEKISCLWGAMVDLCDESAKRLKDLVANHPQCGAEIYYDQMLDLRNKCHRLQQMHA